MNTIRKDELILISLKVRLELFGIPTEVWMDIRVSIINLHILQDLERRMGKTIPLEEWQKGQIVGADGTQLQVAGSIKLCMDQLKYALRMMKRIWNLLL